MAEATNPFLIYTDLPGNAGGDPEVACYERLTHLEALEDWPTSDRVYKNPVTNQCFKIRFGKVAREGLRQLGDNAFLFTTAVCNDAGWAEEWEGGMLSHKIVEPHKMVHQANSLCSLSDAIEQTFLLQCAAAEWALAKETEAEAIAMYPDLPGAVEDPNTLKEAP